MNLEIRHARVVAAIAEAGSISRAASDLALPQPSLTAQLRRIERAVGGPLFVRSASGVAPTPFGERMIPQLVDVVRRFDALLVEGLRGPGRRTRFGCAEWTPVDLRAALARALPERELETVTVPAGVAAQDVASGALGAALVPHADVPGVTVPGAAGLGRTLVAREPAWLLVPEDHPLAGAEVVGSDRLTGLTWVRRAPGSWYADLEGHLLPRLGLSAARTLHHAAGQAEVAAWVRDAGAVALAPPTAQEPGTSAVPLVVSAYTELSLLWLAASLRPEEAAVLARAVRHWYAARALRVPRWSSWLRGHPDDAGLVGSMSA